MSLNSIGFFSKSCKQEKHLNCNGSWSGLGFKFICECICHEEKITVMGDFSKPISTVRTQSVLGDSID